MSKRERSHVVLYANRRAGWRHEKWWMLDKWALGEDIKTYALTDIEEIGSIIKSRLSEQIKLLLVYGGDGTLFWIINNLLSRNSGGLPIIVPVGGGTMNRLHKWTSWQDEPVQNAKTALELFENKRLPILPLRLLKVEWRDKCYHGITFIAGAPVKVLEKYSRFKTTPFIAALFCLSSVAAGLAGRPRFFTDLYGQVWAEVFADDQKLPYDRFIVIAKDVLKRLIFVIEPYRGVCLPEQSFSLAYAIDYRETAREIWRLIFGWFPKEKKYFNQPTVVLSLKPKEKIIFTIDGEFFEAEPGDEIKVSPGQVVPIATNPLFKLPFASQMEDQKDKIKEWWSYFFPTPRGK
jgi:diacylglycerol kinase family enzyme